MLKKEILCNTWRYIIILKANVKTVMLLPVSNGFSILSLPAQAAGATPGRSRWDTPALLRPNLLAIYHQAICEIEATIIKLEVYYKYWKKKLRGGCYIKKHIYSPCNVVQVGPAD